MTNRRTVQIGILLAAMLAVAGCTYWFFFASGDRDSGKDVPEFRNIMLISIDTCRADHLSCYGFDQKTTPHIDAVADEGILFTRAHSTNPITLPAHSSMLTGTNPPYHGVHDNQNYRLSEDNVSLAEILQDHGYQTSAFVSAFVLKSGFGLNQGFETYDDDVIGDDETALITERIAGDTSRRANQWLDHHGREPFFMFLHFFDPHTSYRPPEPFASRFSKSRYVGEIAYVDHCIGLVIERLKSLGIYDSTLLIITSDHGESLGEHGENTHSYFAYQSTIRVPLIIRAPGRVGRGKRDELISIIDIVPTVLSLLKISQPPHIQGEDLSKALQVSSESADRSLYCESLYPTKYGCNGLYGLIQDRWKYIWTTRPELYNLEHDPTETTNLIEKEPDIAAELHAALQNVLLQQTRSHAAKSLQQHDRKSIARLKSLGYVGGAVNAKSLEVAPGVEDPKDFVDLHNRLMIAQALYRAGELERARLESLELLKRRPRDLTILMTLGLIAEKAGRHAGAVSFYSKYLAVAAEVIESSTKRKVLHFNTELTLVHNRLGLSLVQLGNVDQGISHFKKALEIDARSDWAHYHLGDALRTLGRPKEAIPHFRQAIQLAPKTANMHNGLGRTLGMLGQNRDAAVHLREAVRLNPNFAEAHSNLGVAMQALGRPKEALVHLREAVRLEPNSVLAHRNLGMVYERLGRYQEVVQHYKNVLIIHSNDAEAHKNIARVLGRLSRYEEARTHLERAIQLKPHDAQTHNNLAVTLEAMRRFEQSIAHYRDAIRLKPDYIKAHNNLGEVLLNLDRPQEAVSHFKIVLRLKPNELQAEKNLQRAEAQLKKNRALQENK